MSAFDSSYSKRAEEGELTRGQIILKPRISPKQTSHINNEYCYVLIDKTGLRRKTPQNEECCLTFYTWKKEASLLQMSPLGNKTGEKMDVANCFPAVICNYACFKLFLFQF